jgi:PAS domain S-box-containing protein
MLAFPGRGLHADLILAGNEFIGLLESTPIAMLLLDARGNVQAANGETEVLFGYNRSFLVGKTVEILLPGLFPKDPAGRGNSFDTNGDSRSRPVRVELQGQSKDGSRFPVRVHLAPLDRSEETSLVVAVRDLTHVKFLEEAMKRQRMELEQERRRAERSERFAGELLAALSAELKPALGAILALAESAHQGALASPYAEHRRHLGMLVGAARQLLGFTARMGRTFAAEQSGRLSRKSVFRLRGLVRAANATAAAQPVAEEPHEASAAETRSRKHAPVKHPRASINSERS